MQEQEAVKATQEIPEAYREMLSRSVTKSYTESDRHRLGMEPTPKVQVFRQGCWTLYRCGTEFASDYDPVLIIPSLINRNYILDLLPGHSLIEQMKVYQNRLWSVMTLSGPSIRSCRKRRSSMSEMCMYSMPTRPQ